VGDPEGPAGIGALAVDGGGDLYIGGAFEIAGGVGVNNVAKWSGGAWSALGSGVDGNVSAMAVDAGGNLYVGGNFTTAGGVSASNIARWNGTSWSPLGIGLNNPVRALAVDAAGNVYAGGYFTTAGGVSVNFIARWDGANWSALGSNGTNQGVEDLYVFDDGSGHGSCLYAAGAFTSVDGVAAKRVARWNGSSWSALDGGLGSAALGEYAIVLCSYDDGADGNSDLYAGGTFTSAAGSATGYIAQWRGCCTGSIASYCTAGTSANACSAAIVASGIPSASASSGFTLHASGVEGQRFAMFFYGISGALASPWGTSTLCVRAPRQRMGQQLTSGTAGQCDGALAMDWSAFLASHPAAIGSPLQPGRVVHAQTWYRDPPSTKTTALSDALTFTLCP
jgi:hypothetical protein